MSNIDKKDFVLQPEHEQLLTKYVERLKRQLEDLQAPDAVQVEISTTILRNILEDENKHI